MNQIIIRPIISEKSLSQAAKSRYTFEVALKAGKEMIRKTIEELFRVNVLDIKTMIIKGKSARYGKKRTLAKRSNWKKAIVRLPVDQKIELFTVPTGEGGKA